jgi:hypothetical protein
MPWKHITVGWCWSMEALHQGYYQWRHYAGGQTQQILVGFGVLIAGWSSSSG